MSEISTRLRNYVNDPTVADHYGEWGILRRDQRRQIRQLCDTCDMFEHAADAMCMEIEELKSKNSNLTSDLSSLRTEIEGYKKHIDNDIIYVDAVRAEAVKEFAEIIVADYPEMEYYLDNLVKEFTEGDQK